MIFQEKKAFTVAKLIVITSLKLSQHAKEWQIELCRVVWQAWHIVHNRCRDGAMTAGSRFWKAPNNHALYRLNKEADSEYSLVGPPLPRLAQWKLVAPPLCQVRGEQWSANHAGRGGYHHHHFCCWWQELVWRLWQRKWESQLQDNVSFSRNLPYVWHFFWGWKGWPSSSSSSL